MNFRDMKREKRPPGLARTPTQKGLSRLIRGGISTPAYDGSLYPWVYAGRFLERHWMTFWSYLPPEVHQRYAERDFQAGDAELIIHAWAAGYRPDQGITAEWLAGELAEAFLTEDGIEAP
jgi:hypothetical protein